MRRAPHFEEFPAETPATAGHSSRIARESNIALVILQPYHAIRLSMQTKIHLKHEVISKIPISHDCCVDNRKAGNPRENQVLQCLGTSCRGIEKADACILKEFLSVMPPDADLSIVPASVRNGYAMRRTQTKRSHVSV